MRENLLKNLKQNDRSNKLVRICIRDAFRFSSSETEHATFCVLNARI